MNIFAFRYLALRVHGLSEARSTLPILEALLTVEESEAEHGLLPEEEGTGQGVLLVTRWVRRVSQSDIPPCTCYTRDACFTLTADCASAIQSDVLTPKRPVVFSGPPACRPCAGFVVRKCRCGCSGAV